MEMTPEEILRKARDVLLGAADERFFSSLTVHLCDALQVDVAVVGRVHERTVRSVAVQAFGQAAPPLEYELVGTPCETVISDRARGYGSRVQDHFPHFDLLRELNVESYVGAALLDSDGTAVGLIAVLHSAPLSDVDLAQTTLQVFAARAAWELERIRQQELLELYRGVVDSAGDLISVVDLEYRYRTVNDAYSRMFLKPKDQIVGRHVAGLHGSARFQNEIRPYLDLAFEGRASRQERWVEIGEGERRFVATHYAPHVNPGGGIDGAVVMSRDTTESKILQDEKMDLEEALRQAQRMDALGQLAGGIAHEFNNLLTILLGYSELLAAHSVIQRDSMLSDYVGQIEAAGERGRRVVDQLLRFSRRRDLAPGRIELADLLHKTRDMLRPVLPSSIALEVHTDEALVWVNGDASQLQQAIVNLCLNARDAAAKRGRIAITCPRTFRWRVPVRLVAKRSVEISLASRSPMGVGASTPMSCLKSSSRSSPRSRSGREREWAWLWCTVLSMTTVATSTWRPPHRGRVSICCCRVQCNTQYGLPGRHSHRVRRQSISHTPLWRGCWSLTTSCQFACSSRRY
ncbi:MAG: PAS domain-containing protein [Gammaproteobacteria bacterium]|nr:PAS domain-containing protein [Gammaproteobacteria bacterium]